MTLDNIVTPPSVSWAQCTDKVYLTFNVECEKPDIKIENKSVSFNGSCSPNQTLHEITIPTYAELDPEKSSFVNKGRYIEVVLHKLVDQPFWPTLTSDGKKHHWLKVDFNRWHDEDDSDEDDVDMFSSKLGEFGDENDDDDAYGGEEDLTDYS